MKGQLTRFSHILGSVTFKSSMMLAFTAMVVATLAFGVEKLAVSTDNTACACSSETRYNNTLPSSHPNNRCANQAQALSWKTWLTGKNRSSQFHFVDLLELLHGHQDKPIDDMKPTNSQLSY
ncbi:hypothetical protein [Shewanella sp. CG12_big_fil_rev_8_21_14_0_65_47_15]|uniref:hypothetical protein n=1 Tax=Shewanella sp. CG12_big_fil_rev_8_21_14_0_65_47_15 TaxID=1975537 RepID=UPI000CBB8AEA|nr:hypothetical protein [Shewanella sp. CG12_big_fil_rev_8_21_14_0_65_47_15]PIW62299.1 MAG: hypothetical protein COW15_04040 [Shewanella sp. CG12_big_fil_rev_8_21_14_0_65_47_15]